MQHIETIVLGSTQAAIEFLAIPQDFTDLLLVFSGRVDGSNTGGYEIFLQLNSVGLSSDSRRNLLGNGSSASSGTVTTVLGLRVGMATSLTETANTFGNTSIYIPNYSSTTQYKSVSADGVAENNATASFQMLSAGLRQSNDAVTSLKIFPQSQSWVQYSSASLYGITAGSDGITAVS